MKTDDLNYELPAELIAQHPAERRDESRLLVYDRASGDVRHRRFFELPEELRGELVVVNDTRVVPARLKLRRETRRRGRGAAVENLEGDSGRRSHDPRGGFAAASALGRSSCSSRWARAAGSSACTASPTARSAPPYITEPLAEPERYQTVYSREAGSAAAPTAGLHFTPELLSRLDVERVTLHVGLDTFRPLAEDDLSLHRLHGERYEVPARGVGADRWRRPGARGRDDDGARAGVARARRAARGPHRALHPPGLRVPPRRRAPDELPPAALDAARPGDGFRRRGGDARLYRLAVEERYRFYSFGDAMLVL